MSTENENTMTSLYAYQYNGGELKKISHTNNLVEKIVDLSAKNGIEGLSDYSPENIRGEKFDRFVKDAKNAGFTIYHLTKL